MVLFRSEQSKDTQCLGRNPKQASQSIIPGQKGNQQSGTRRNNIQEAEGEA